MSSSLLYVYLYKRIFFPGHIQELGRLKDNYENKVTQLAESVKKLSVQLSAASLERDTKEQQLQTERVQNQEHSSALLTQMTTIQTKAQEIQVRSTRKWNKCIRAEYRS